MSTLSLCMIVKNEQSVLKRCLDSCKGIFDEIIIVDTGSVDKTKSIAKQFTDKIYDFEWINDFSKARNFSFSLATSDYIMWLDADDIIPPQSKKQLLNLKQKLKTIDADAIMLKYDISFDSNNKANFSYYRERIVKNGKFLWQDPVHEVIHVYGNIEYREISIEHHKLPNKKYSDRNLKIYESLINKNIKLNARQTYYYARELMFNNQTDKAINIFKTFLVMQDAWVENLISACIDLSNCYKQKQDIDNALLSLFLSFKFDSPRAEICSLIGDIFQDKNNLEQAIFWYKIALSDKINLKSGAFVQQEYYGLYPSLQLCVCYFKLGDIKNAKKYNTLAGKFNSKNASFLSNKNFFDNLKNA